MLSLGPLIYDLSLFLVKQKLVPLTSLSANVADVDVEDGHDMFFPQTIVIGWYIYLQSKSSKKPTSIQKADLTAYYP